MECQHCPYLKTDIEDLEYELNQKEQELVQVEDWCRGIEKALLHKRNKARRLARDLSQAEEDVCNLKHQFEQSEIQRKQLARKQQSLEESNENLSQKVEEMTFGSNEEREKLLQEQQILKDSERDLRNSLELALFAEHEAKSSVLALRNSEEGLRTEIKQVRDEQGSTLKSFHELQSEIIAMKEEKNRLMAETVAKEGLLKGCHLELEKEKIRNLALCERLAEYTLNAATLKQSILSCWLHRFGTWLKYIRGSSVASRSMNCVLSSWYYIKRLRGTVGWVGIA